MRELHDFIYIVVLWVGNFTSLTGHHFDVSITVGVVIHPSRPQEMWPDCFSEYEYVDGGAFAEPWLDVLPWTSVKIWEWGYNHV